MDNVSIALGSVLMIAFVLMLAPSVMRMNKGVALRNAAIWIALFCALALAYRTVGPGGALLNADEEQVIEDGMTPDDQEDVPEQSAAPTDIDQGDSFEPPHE